MMLALISFAVRLAIFIGIAYAVKGITGDFDGMSFLGGMIAGLLADGVRAGFKEASHDRLS